MLNPALTGLVLLVGLFWALKRGALPEHFRTDGDELGGWLDGKAWFARYSRGRWEGPRYINKPQADNWFFDALEASQHEPMASNALARWTGARWELVR